ncbi:hypothetical protein V6N13_093783 [Hibiscus sabdariffa]|uniref:Uncharacterized protein n=1 Tax=Hibiscus sabdariffa TaxID=183260 RepID=A0ABR2NKV7_9ROSI
MHFLQSERLGFPPSQLQRLMHLDLEAPPHMHRAMQRRSGTHRGQPYFICSTRQSLHPLLLPPPLPPLEEHPSAGEAINEHNISRITMPKAELVSFCFFFTSMISSKFHPPLSLSVWLIPGFYSGDDMGFGACDENHVVIRCVQFIEYGLFAAGPASFIQLTH